MTFFSSVGWGLQIFFKSVFPWMQWLKCNNAYCYPWTWLLRKNCLRKMKNLGLGIERNSGYWGGVFVSVKKKKKKKDQTCEQPLNQNRTNYFYWDQGSRTFCSPAGQFVFVGSLNGDLISTVTVILSEKLARAVLSIFLDWVSILRLDDNTRAVAW